MREGMGCGSLKVREETSQVHAMTPYEPLRSACNYCEASENELKFVCERLKDICYLLIIIKKRGKGNQILKDRGEFYCAAVMGCPVLFEAQYWTSSFDIHVSIDDELRTSDIPMFNRLSEKKRYQPTSNFDRLSVMKSCGISLSDTTRSAQQFTGILRLPSTIGHVHRIMIV